MVYGPCAVPGVKFTCSVVLPLDQAYPVICENSFAPPGPVKLSTSADGAKLAGSIAALKLKSMKPGAVACTPLGALLTTYGPAEASFGRSVFATGLPRPTCPTSATAATGIRQRWDTT